MHLPRRVPWASPAELEQVCTWIYAEETDFGAIQRALDRLTAWAQATPLPHALDACLGLLSVKLLDVSSLTSPVPRPSGLALRLTYAAALTRLVNGLVDPLQVGAYARSIAQLAAQLGLPAWLVELRHAATHEELPGLEVLREGVRQSLAWLYDHYFMPTLHPSRTLPQAPVLRPLAPLLDAYKTLQKLVIRDASLKKRHEPDIIQVLRDVERWLSEARVAKIAAEDGTGWDIGPQEREERGVQRHNITGEGAEDHDESDAAEAWALNRLCDALLEPGTLVPASKKKRVLPTGAFLPPPALVSLWSPLLQHLHSLHPALAHSLANRIVAHLLSPLEEGQRVESSYDALLAAWAAWVIEEWHVESRDVVTTIVRAMTGAEEGVGARKAAWTLFHTLCDDATLKTTMELLRPSSLTDNVQPEWTDEDLGVMSDRLQAVLRAIGPDAGNTELNGDVDMLGAEASSTAEATLESTRTTSLPQGWRLLDESTGWRPAPMGVFVTCV